MKYYGYYSVLRHIYSPGFVENIKQWKNFGIIPERPFYSISFIVLCYVLKIFRKMFRELKKLSYINGLMYNLVTWFD